MKNFVKFAIILIGQFLVLPLVIPTWLESWVSKDKELIFNTCSQGLAFIPGFLGVLFRRSYYSLTLEKCSPHCHIGFGSLISHRSVIIEPHVYIGNYALIGSASLGEHSLIGSRASIISGKYLHEKKPDGSWSKSSSDRFERIHVGRQVWIGEGALIIADIGAGSCVGAGSVVSTTVRPDTMVVGNPARFVKTFDTKVQAQPDPDEK